MPIANGKERDYFFHFGASIRQNAVLNPSILAQLTSLVTGT